MEFVGILLRTADRGDGPHSCASARFILTHASRGHRNFLYGDKKVSGQAVAWEDDWWYTSRYVHFCSPGSLWGSPLEQCNAGIYARLYHILPVLRLVNHISSGIRVRGKQTFCISRRMEKKFCRLRQEPAPP